MIILYSGDLFAAGIAVLIDGIMKFVRFALGRIELVVDEFAPRRGRDLVGGANPLTC